MAHFVIFSNCFRILGIKDFLQNFLLQDEESFDIMLGLWLYYKNLYFMAQNSKKVYEFEGVVKECLPNTKFLIELDIDGNKRDITGYLSGKMRMHYIRIIEGDRVTIEMTPYDKEIGRITYRFKK